MSDIAPDHPRSFFALTDHEVYVLCASHDGRENAQIATWILPATLVTHMPRLVAIVSPRNLTAELIAASGTFTASMLAVGQEMLVPRLGLRSGRDVEKLEGIPLRRTSRGLPVPDGCCGWCDCEIRASIDGGDRRIYLADIVESTIYFGRTPLRKNEAYAALPADVRASLEAKRRDDGALDAAIIRRFGTGASAPES